MNQETPVIYLAPFQGITTYTYRECYSKHFPFVDKLYTPFYSSVPTEKGNASKARELEVLQHNHIPVIPQILSKNASEMLHFANHCHQLGHREINWNLGCPYSRVANKKRGSGMLPHPEMVEEILSGLMSNIPTKLSVKCRLGYHAPTEIESLIPLFNQYNISELTVHARLGIQLYKGAVDWDSLAGVVDLIQIPLVYNGDIFSSEDYQTFSRQFPQISRVMIGRGLLTDPFLPAKIKGLSVPGLEDQKILVKKFMEDLYLSYRKHLNDRLNVIGIMKELWANLTFGFENPGKVFGGIKKCHTFDEYETSVAHVFNEYQWVGSDAQLLKTFGNNL
ncbi:MAG: hypothetical protein CVT99_13185 [Bacteroidetes bacterium HGW-Bacteroidetes-16]|jgi:tRNA-dihydrouridine synthase|nr:MAG: hypothetical protein CVT99_13185 [Bacteroidetes bacterium HGW-Bacteroidetes-16]